MEPDPRLRELEEASLMAPLEIAGHELRPFGLASFVLLRRIKNRLVTGGMATVKTDAGEELIDFNDPDNVEAVLEFIYVHSAPIREVIRSARDAEGFREAVLVHTADISLEALTAAAGEITQTIRTAGRAVTESPEESEREAPDPNGHGPRG